MLRAATDSDAATVAERGRDRCVRSRLKQNAKSTGHSPICAPLVWSHVNVQLVGSEWSQTSSEPGRRRGARGRWCLCCSALASRVLWKRLLALWKQLFAFVDDIYVLWRGVFFSLAGIHLNQGETRVWNKAGIPPEDVTFWAPRRGSRGHCCVGNPLGSAQSSLESCKQVLRRCKLSEAIPTVPHLQCGWQILLQNANPRRTLPPSSSAE